MMVLIKDETGNMENLLGFYKSNLTAKAYLSKTQKIYRFIGISFGVLFLFTLLWIAILMFFRFTKADYESVLTIWVIIFAQLFYFLFQIFLKKYKKRRRLDIEKATQKTVYNIEESLRTHRIAELVDYLKKENRYNVAEINNFVMRFDNAITNNMISSSRQFNVYFWLSALIAAFYITKLFDIYPEVLKRIFQVLNFETSLVETLVYYPLFLIGVWALKWPENAINALFFERREFVWTHRRASDEGELLKLLDIIYSDLLRKSVKEK